jgi:hypothetical protein
MPTPCPAEFRAATSVAVARKHEAPISQMAREFGDFRSNPGTTGLRKPTSRDGARPGVTEGGGGTPGCQETDPAVETGERDPAPCSGG